MPHAVFFHDAIPPFYPTGGSMANRLLFAHAFFRTFSRDPVNANDYVTRDVLALLTAYARKRCSAGDVPDCFQIYTSCLSFRRNVLHFHELPLLGEDDIPRSLARLKVVPGQSLEEFTRDALARFHGLSTNLLERWFRVQLQEKESVGPARIPAVGSTEIDAMACEYTLASPLSITLHGHSSPPAITASLPQPLISFRLPRQQPANLAGSTPTYSKHIGLEFFFPDWTSLGV